MTPDSRLSRARALLLASVVALGLIASPAQAKEVVRRFALVVGANSGGGERVTLRYANSDAKRFAHVVGAYGGVQRGDLVTLYEATPAKIRTVLETLRGRIAKARARHRRVELVFYYSGHSDERGLLPGGERLDWAELRTRLAALGADVRIAILDSCASGAMIRTKGGKRRAPFLFDASSQVKGHAYLTSSSANEVAQESDRIQASYFTHHLVTGLRGAADVDGDRRVTLSEAYQYAFHRTLARTERTAKGPQHANYDFELAGSGDIVLTGLSQSASVLVFGKPTVGRFFIRDRVGQLVAELEKVPGRRVEIGLEPGDYRLNLHQRGRVYTTTVRLSGRVNVDVGTFHEASRVATRSRGGAPGGPDVVHQAPPPAQPTSGKQVAFDIGFAPFVSFRGVTFDAEVRRMSLYLIGGVHRVTRGLAAASVFNIATTEAAGMQGAGALNVSLGNMHGVQAAGALNLAAGEVDGGQFAGAVNVSHAIRGVQAAGALNLSGTVRGAQLAGAVNLGGVVHGLQVAGAANVASDLRGVQAGVVNVAGTSTGTQFGVFNVSSGGSGDAYGLFSFIRNGYNHLELWTSDTGIANVGLKFGGQHMYTLLMAGYSTRGDDKTEFGIGWGGHVDLTDRLYLDFDGLAGTFWDSANPERVNDMLVRSRVMVGFRVFNRLAVFGGVKANWAIAFDHREPRETLCCSRTVTSETQQTQVNLSPGAFLGVQL